MMAISSDQLAAYQRNGYLLVEELVTPNEVAALCERLREYTHGERSREGLAIQIEPRVERGEIQVQHPGDGIRKIDLLVQHDDLFQRLVLHPNMVGVVQGILGPDIKLYRNTLLLKPPEVGSQKGWHQDSPYWPIEPMNLCSCWLPLDDATPENGCMVVLPGWHKRGPLPHVSVTDDYVIAEEQFDPSARVAVPMRAGSGLFFHSLLPHYTGPNRSSRWRRAIAITYMSAESRYTGDGLGMQYLHVSGKTYAGCVQ
jgi:phytanoyl-CoA hydroxylase